MDLDRWRNAESLDGLPVSAEVETTPEERAWAGERIGNLTWGILAAIVAIGSAAAAVGGYLLNAGHWGFAVIAVASTYIVVRYPWKIPRRPSPEKLAELQAYKEKLRPKAEGDLAEASEVSEAAPAESDLAEVPEASEVEPAVSAMPEVPEAEPAASDLPEVPEVLEGAEESEAARADGESAAEPAEEPTDEPADELAAWDGLSRDRVESSVSTKLETEGFKVKATRVLKDGGIDVEALDEHWAPVVVQVKPQQKNVGVSVVREMIGVREKRPDKPRVIIYSPVGFTRGATGLAKTSGVELREFDKDDAGPGRTEKSAGKDRSLDDGRILDV